MAQPNVAREPSMDEILASIRKIIESNDVGPAIGMNTFESDADEDAEISLTVDETINVEPPVDVSRNVEPVQEKTVVEVAPAKSLSLADVAARVRAASQVRHEPMAAAPVASEPVAEPKPAVAEVAPLQLDSPYERMLRDMPEAVAAHPVAAEPLQTVTAVVEADPIISRQTGEQVARSFGDLATALDNSARRSFDDIAQEMLRPMLQEWLDDNLPTLVEKLVREEIERVARGPRR